MNIYSEDIDRILGTFPDVDKAWKMYSENDLFRRVVMAMVNGASVEGLLMNVIEINTEMESKLKDALLFQYPDIKIPAP
jgi:hypothetical protein